MPCMYVYGRARTKEKPDFLFLRAWLAEGEHCSEFNRFPGSLFEVALWPRVRMIGITVVVNSWKIIYVSLILLSTARYAGKFYYFSLLLLGFSLEFSNRT